MKIPIIKLAPKFLNFFGSDIVGMTLFPFILVKTKEQLDDTATINHESIHIYQQRELLVLPFYIWYGIEYLIRSIKYGFDQGYYKISFEQEAYTNENNLEYLKTRKPYSFLKYL